METVNVSGLKNNPSEALRKCHQGVVVVLNRDKPEALMVGIELAGVLDAKGVEALSKLPSLDQLRGKLIGLLQAPATKVAGVLQAPAGQLARVFNAYATKAAA
jgi:ribosomal protein L10